MSFFHIFSKYMHLRQLFLKDHTFARVLESFAQKGLLQIERKGMLQIVLDFLKKNLLTLSCVNSAVMMWLAKHFFF